LKDVNFDLLGDYLIFLNCYYDLSHILIIRSFFVEFGFGFLHDLPY